MTVYDEASDVIINAWPWVPAFTWGELWWGLADDATHVINRTLDPSLLC